MTTAVYLIGDLDRPSMVKVGIANDLAARLQTHRCTAPGCAVVASWVCIDRREALDMEREVLDLARGMPGVQVIQEWVKGVVPLMLADAIDEECLP